jgi:hypothetical protein
VNRQGAVGIRGRGVEGKIRGNIGKTGGNAAVLLARRPRASDWSRREVPMLPIGSCRAGVGTGAPTHLLGSLPRRHDFETAGASILNLSLNNTLTNVLEDILEPRWR